MLALLVESLYTFFEGVFRVPKYPGSESCEKFENRGLRDAIEVDTTELRFHAAALRPTDELYGSGAAASSKSDERTLEFL